MNFRNSPVGNGLAIVISENSGNSLSDVAYFGKPVMVTLT